MHCLYEGKDRISLLSLHKYNAIQCAVPSLIENISLLVNNTGNFRGKKVIMVGRVRHVQMVGRVRSGCPTVSVSQPEGRVRVCVAHFQKRSTPLRLLSPSLLRLVPPSSKKQPQLQYPGKSSSE